MMSQKTTNVLIIGYGFNAIGPWFL